MYRSGAPVGPERQCGEHLLGNREIARQLSREARQLLARGEPCAPPGTVLGRLGQSLEPPRRGGCLEPAPACPGERPHRHAVRADSPDGPRALELGQAPPAARAIEAAARIARCSSTSRNAAPGVLPAVPDGAVQRREDQLVAGRVSARRTPRLRIFIALPSCARGSGVASAPARSGTAAVLSDNRRASRPTDSVPGPGC